MRNVKNWPVMKSLCASCLFQKNGDTQLRASIEARVFSNSQICHHPVLKGNKETHLCRGSRDYQLEILYRLGMIVAPTDEAFALKSKELKVI